jgi:hypothetical protein
MEFWKKYKVYIIVAIVLLVIILVWMNKDRLFGSTGNSDSAKQSKPRPNASGSGSGGGGGGKKSTGTGSGKPKPTPTPPAPTPTPPANSLGIAEGLGVYMKATGKVYSKPAMTSANEEGSGVAGEFMGTTTGVVKTWNGKNAVEYSPDGWSAWGKRYVDAVLVDIL